MERGIEGCALSVTYKGRKLFASPRMNCYDLSNSQMSRMIFSNRLLDSDFLEYSCNESFAFALLLNDSTILFLVHFFNEKPGDKT